MAIVHLLFVGFFLLIIQFNFICIVSNNKKNVSMHFTSKGQTLQNNKKTRKYVWVPYSHLEDICISL